MAQVKDYNPLIYSVGQQAKAVVAFFVPAVVYAGYAFVNNHGWPGWNEIAVAAVTGMLTAAGVFAKSNSKKNQSDLPDSVY